VKKKPAFMDGVNDFYRLGGVEVRWRIKGNSEAIDSLNDRKLFEIIISAN